MQATDVVTAAAIREPVLRGHQFVAALWFPATWFDEAVRAARVIDRWRPGARALRFAQGDLLYFAEAIEENCGDLPGWALRQEGGALCSAPLSSGERAAIRDGDVWIVLGAEVLKLHRHDAQPLDVSAWIAIDHLSLHDTYDCSVPVPPSIVLDLDSRPLREILGDSVPPASRERDDFLKAMQRVQKDHPRGLPQSRGGRRVPGAGAAFIVVLIAAVVVVLLAAIVGNLAHFPYWSLLLVIFVVRLLLSLASANPIEVRARKVSPPTGVKARSRFEHPQRWRRWLSYLAATTQLSRLLGRAHARHLRRVLGMFDDGDLDEALRHAIPLDGDRGSLGESFGTPERRGSLEVSRVHGPSTSIGLDVDIQQHLRTLYRRAFEQLDRQGRVDEAVFVLADLLNAKREALDYLEKQERFAQAAELALGWDMSPDIIVRLHCLAGDWRRAVAVARRDNAFSAAVVQLEKRWPDAARRLREEWGNALVQQGDWLAAVDAVWPIESLRTRATEWLLTAEAAGGRLGARALVQRAMLLPDTLEHYAQELRALQIDSASWRQRQAMADALTGIARTPVTTNLGALIAPAMLADHARGFRRFGQHALQTFIQSTGDILLQADLPTRDWPGMKPEPLSQRSETLCLEAPDAGVNAILDAVPLHDDCFLVALGEAGACVVEPSGRIRARFAAPTQQLVIAHSRQVALLLARREGLWRVSRLDLARNSVVDLGMVAFDFCATQFDGLHWTIAHRRSLKVLDTQDSLRQVVWQVSDLPGDICVLTANSSIEQVVLAVPDAPRQLWSYRLPSRHLLMRDDIKVNEGQLSLLNPDGGALEMTIQAGGGLLGLRWQLAGKSPQYEVQASMEDLRLWIAGDWLVVGTRDEAGYMIRWVLLGSGNEHAQIRWPADADLSVRQQFNDWQVFDTRGRLVTIDVSTCAWRALGLR